ncbi:MAG: LON peptidase substrate-binding domain-containing protein [Rhodospirillales bacterium]
MSDPFATRYEALPQILPIFPLTGAVLLPGGRLPLNIFEPRYLAMVSDALGSGRMIGMIQPLKAGGFAGDGVSEQPDEPPAVQPIGCAGRISSFGETQDGRLLVTLSGACRFMVAEELPLHEHGYRRVQPDYSRFAADLQGGNEQVELDRSRLLGDLRRYFAANNLATDWKTLEQVDDAGLITTICMAAPFDAAEKQALLEAETATLRGKLLIAFLEQAVLANSNDNTSQPRH